MKAAAGLTEWKHLGSNFGLEPGKNRCQFNKASSRKWGGKGEGNGFESKQPALCLIVVCRRPATVRRVDEPPWWEQEERDWGDDGARRSVRTRRWCKHDITPPIAQYFGHKSFSKIVNVSPGY